MWPQEHSAAALARSGAVGWDHGMTDAAALLLDRLRSAGFDDVVGVEPATEGLAAVSGTATRADGSTVFVKTYVEAPSDDAFLTEAEGLTVLRMLGGMPTPEVLAVSADLLVLGALAPRPTTEDFWETLAHGMVRLHAGTVHERFGWHRDNWLGRRRQVNTWTEDGYEFFARHRLLRWLDEPRVEGALDAEDRAALEHLCARLPELLPERPACLTHGDFWFQNVLATPEGAPALIDPAVSYTWAEVDLAHVWTTAPPPEAARFFDVYAELTGLDDDWQARMPILQLRQHLAVVAQFEPDWGAAQIIRETVASFRRR